jgi:hypothetical protein
MSKPEIKQPPLPFMVPAAVIKVLNQFFQTDALCLTQNLIEIKISLSFQCGVVRETQSQRTGFPARESKLECTQLLPYQNFLLSFSNKL